MKKITAVHSTDIGTNTEVKWPSAPINDLNKAATIYPVLQRYI